ncbi:terminase small subunit [Paenibacillus elgii]
MKLTEKQKRFADYFIETGNASEAAKRAGYRGKNLNRIASENLTKPDIRKYIDVRIAEKDDARIAKQDEILEFLTSVLRGQVKEQFPLGMGMGEQSLEKKELDGKDRIKAAELLGKRYAMWTDRQQLDGAVGVQLIDDIGSEWDDDNTD